MYGFEMVFDFTGSKKTDEAERAAEWLAFCEATKPGGKVFRYCESPDEGKNEQAPAGTKPAGGNLKVRMAL